MTSAVSLVPVYMLILQKLTSVFLLGFEELLDLFTNFSIRNLYIVLSLAVVSHKIQKAIIRDIKLLNFSTYLLTSYLMILDLLTEVHDE